MLTNPIPVIAFEPLVGIIESQAARLASRLRNELSPLAAGNPDNALAALQHADTSSNVSQEELAVANLAVAVSELQMLVNAPDFDTAAFHRTLERIQAVSFRLGTVLTVCAVDRLARQEELAKRPPLTLVPKPAPQPEPVPATPEPVQTQSVNEAELRRALEDVGYVASQPSGDSGGGLFKSIFGFDLTK